MFAAAVELDKSGNLNKKMVKVRKKLAWRGSEEIEEIYKLFTAYVTNPANKNDNLLFQSNKQFSKQTPAGATSSLAKTPGEGKKSEGEEIVPK